MRLKEHSGIVDPQEDACNRITPFRLCFTVSREFHLSVISIPLRPFSNHDNPVTSVRNFIIHHSSLMPEYIYMLENPHRSLLVSELNSSSRVIKIRTPNSEKQSSFQLSETQYSVFLQLRDTNLLERDPTIVYSLFPVSLDKTFSAFNNSNYVPLMIYLYLHLDHFNGGKMPSIR